MGDLGLVHLDWNYFRITTAVGVSIFTTVSATDQPSPSTLTDVTGIEYLKGAAQPATNLVLSMSSWNLTNIVSFANAFANVLLNTDNNAMSNWTLSNTKPVDFYKVFNACSGSVGLNISIANWNPVVKDLDLAFQQSSGIFPDIRTWTLLPFVCANNFISQNTFITQTLYDALLIKFAAETSSRNCTWVSTQTTTSGSPAVAQALVTLCCNRTWTISDTAGTRCLPAIC